MKAIIAIIICLASFASHADDWHGADKGKHLLAGALVGATITAATREKSYGIAAGCAVGIAKEAYDSRAIGHQVSAKDAIVTCIGAALGAHVAGFYITPRSVSYSWRF